jgi:choline monooxygenase
LPPTGRRSRHRTGSRHAIPQARHATDEVHRVKSPNPPHEAAGLAAIAAALRRTPDQPYDRAWAMPSTFYTDESLLALEREQLFGREWICVGRREELAERGDFMALDIGTEPVVVVHGADGQIRAFSNVCRHRGMPLAAGKGNGKGLMCPYHHWSYDTLGRLIAAPRMPARPDFDVRSCRLPGFALEEWLGFLFVCLAPDPPPLAPRLAGIEALVRPYHLEQTTVRYLADEVWPTNWKNVLENFMEGYHLSTLHQATLHLVNPTRLCRHVPAEDAYFAYQVGFVPEMQRERRGHPDLTDPQLDDCVMFAVPPGLAVGCASDYSSFICFQPESIDRVRVKLGLIFYGPDWPQATVDWAVELFRNTMAEDKTVLVELGRGRRSRHYSRGPLAPAPFEGPILDFYRYVNRVLGPALATATASGPR